MRVKQKHTAAVAALWIALVSLALIGGALFYIYNTTDETVVPDLDVSLNGDSLFYGSASWNTPVFDGLVYKSFGVAIDREETVPLVEETMFALRAPAECVTQVTVRDPMGNVMTPIEQPGEYKYAAVRNGTYTYELTVTVPKKPGKAYGEYHTQAALP